MAAEAEGIKDLELIAESHTFTLSSEWTGNSDGDGKIVANSWGVGYGVPEELGGLAGRSNPEELIIAAVISCFSITLAFLAEKRRIPLQKISATASGTVVRQPGGTLKLTSITLRPIMTVTGLDDNTQTTLADCAHKAEQYCLISSAIRGNVEILLEPTYIEA